MRPPFILAAALTLVPASAALAQEHEHGAHDLGRVTFPVSCTPEAQRRFNHAMAVLHSFWWEEAPRAFGAVLQADSSCAMAHWGLAMTAWGNPFAGGPLGDALRTASGEAERAAAMGGKTKREAGFIAAVAALYRNSAATSNASRLQAYADTLARAYRDIPGDEELAIYYALSLVATASRTDTTFANQKRSAAILNPLFVKHPDHPGLAHYIIHANDTPRLASLGLDAARRYASIAPAVPHAQHMPSHIFIRLGLWDEAIASNEKAFDAGVTYARTTGMAGIPYEQFHALDYMVYSYLQRGEDSAARRVVASALALRAIRRPGVVDGYNLTAMEARVALERSDWAAAEKLPQRGDASAPLAEALSHFVHAIGAARVGDTAVARVEIESLARIEQALAANEPYWSRIVRLKRQSAGAWLLFASGDTTGALQVAKTAADEEDVTEKHQITPGELLPARELEADMHLAAGHAAVARDAYLAVLRREPGRARSVFGAATAAERAGDHRAAVAGYRDFLKLMEKGDGERPEITLARAAVDRP